MTSFISNIIWNSVEGFVDAGKKTAGEYGGNALIKAGDMIENGGRSVGNGKLPFSLPVTHMSFQNSLTYVQVSRKRQRATALQLLVKHTNL
jgi:uncharacterized protein (DUF1330 family)